MKKCIYCKQDFTPNKPTTTMCQFCWFSGAHHAAQRPELLPALRAIPGVASADIDHTGGGCFVLAVRLADGRYLVATIAYMDETGEWSIDAGTPEADEPWALAIYRDEEAFYEGRGGDDEPVRLPLNDMELVDAVRGIVGKT